MITIMVSIFLSVHHQKLDAKGRVSVPADFRKVLGDDGLVLYRSYKEPAVLEGMSMKRMLELGESMDRLDPFDTSQDDMSATIFADSYQFKFDLTGRITLPEGLVKHCEFSGDQVLFVGRGKTFQVWDSQRFSEYSQRSRKRIQAAVGRCDVNNVK